MLIPVRAATIFACCAFVAAVSDLGTASRWRKNPARRWKQQLPEFVAGQRTTVGLRLPTILSSDMVLQREPHTPRLWGFANPSDHVRMFLDGKEVNSTKADHHGNWLMELEPQPASVKRSIKFKSSSGESALMKNVAFGDVYLCGGQSNMELCVDAVENSTAEIEDSVNYPNLRMFAVRGSARDEPQGDVMSKYSNKAWVVSGPSAFVHQDRYFSVFSATCYFFGRDLYKQLKGEVPIGLVSSTWSNVPIQVFSSPDSLSDATCGGTRQETNTSVFPIQPIQKPSPSLQPMDGLDHPVELGSLPATVAEQSNIQKDLVTEVKPDMSSEVDSTQISWLSLVKKTQPKPAFLAFSSVEKEQNADNDLVPPKKTQVWNGMFHPLLNLRLSGVVWYQGESNNHEPGVYACLFPALIADWRRKFELPDLEFTYVQVSTGHLPKLPGLRGHMIGPEIRNAQLSGLQLSGTAVVPSYDLGELSLGRHPPLGSMHPRKKQEVGRRLALAVQKLHYGLDVVATGPVVQGFKYDAGSGNVTIDFDPATAAGLHLADIPECKRCCHSSPFEVQTQVGKWLPTEGHEVVGNEVRVNVRADEAHSMPTVVAVRYAHSHQPDCGLYNGVGGADDHTGIIALPFVHHAQ